MQISPRPISLFYLVDDVAKYKRKGVFTIMISKSKFRYYKKIIYDAKKVMLWKDGNPFGTSMLSFPCIDMLTFAFGYQKTN